MKTRDILSEPEAQLAPLLKAMKLKELEKHAQKILQKLGQSDYEYVLGALIKAVPHLGSEDRFKEVQGLVRHMLPEEEREDTDTIQRLSSILMLIIKKKFDKIHSEQP